MDRLLPPRLPRSTLPEPSPKIWSPLAPPPSVCPRNPQSTHLGSLGTRVVRQTDPEGRRLQSFPLQYPQSLGRLPSRHQPRGLSPWQRTRSTCSCQVAQPAASGARLPAAKARVAGGEVGDQRSTGAWQTTCPGSQASARLWAVSSRPGLPGLERQGWQLPFSRLWRG